MATLDLGLLKITVGADTTELDKAQASSTTKVKDMERSFTTASASISSAVVRMSAIVIGAMYAANSALSKATERFIDMRNAAQSLGISTEQMSSLSQAAMLSGVAIEGLSVSMNTLARRMQERDWLSDGVRTFDALGIAVTNSSGQMRGADQVLMQVADRFSMMKDGVAKTNIALTLFGEQGVKLIPFLNQGSSKIDEIRAAFQGLSGAMDGEVQQSYETFYGLQNKISASFNALMNQVVEKLLPSFQALDKWFTTLTADSRAMKGAVDDAVTVFKALETAGLVVVQTFRNIVQVVKFGYDALTAFYQGIFKTMDALKNLDARQAYNAIVEGTNKISDAFTNMLGNVWQSSVQTATAIEGVWSEWQTTVVATVENAAPKMSAPIVKSAQEISDAFNDMKMGAQTAFGVVMDDPLSTLTQKLDAASEAVRNHAISWREFQAVVRTAKQQYNDQMNDMLTLTGQVLTTMFQKSKAAAIAQALISTYVAINKALETYPPPISFAMAGLQAAMGFAQVRNISSTNENSSGGGTAAPSGGSTAAATAAQNVAPQQTLFVQGINQNSLFSADAVRGLAEKLIQFQRDGGQVVLA